MLHIHLRSIIIALTVSAYFLAGCSSNPVYRSTKTYVPPKSEVGKRCVMEAEAFKNQCHQQGDAGDAECKAQARLAAQVEYDVAIAEYQRIIASQKNEQQRCRDEMKQDEFKWEEEYNSCLKEYKMAMNAYQALRKKCDAEFYTNKRSSECLFTGPPPSNACQQKYVIGSNDCSSYSSGDQKLPRLDDFADFSSCNDVSRCNNQYNTFYTECGGGILMQRRCVKDCDEEARKAERSRCFGTCT